MPILMITPSWADGSAPPPPPPPPSYMHISPTGLYCPGVANEYAWRADAAQLTPSTTLEILVRASSNDYTPNTLRAFCGKRLSSAANFGYQFRIATDGKLTLVWGNSSTTVITENSTASTGCTDGTFYWFRVVKNFSTGSISFYKAADDPSIPSTWTQVGTTVSGTAGTLYNDTNQLNIGKSSAEQFAGYIARVTVIGDGSTVFDADFVAAADYASSFSEGNGATVTIVHT